MSTYELHPSSFRDPSGFIFRDGRQVFRQVNVQFSSQYDEFMKSGLYEKLSSNGRLVKHTEIDEDLLNTGDWYKTLRPEQIPFISYAYEWGYDQLKDAGLLVLDIMKESIAQGFILKDATPFNVQFYNGRPVWIDTLSFEKYIPSKPWVAYRQFCECFLFPLYLGRYLKTDIHKTLSTFLEGIPAGLTAQLLPMRSSLSLGVWLHVYLQGVVKQDNKPAPTQGFNRKKLMNLLLHLETIISGLHGRRTGTTWSDYYDATILSHKYLSEKDKLFREMISEISFGSALDVGTNDGYFAKILAEKTEQVIAIDNDTASINRLYADIKKNRIKNILPLQVDITQPSPALGFRNTERSAFLDRLDVQMVSALALVHHLVISRNIPLPSLADFFASLTREYLVIEFVPPQDPKVKELTRNKTSWHPYDQDTFEECFKRHFDVDAKLAVPSSERTLYLMRKK